ncbi:hypothetical protein [Alkalibacillus haloalkaliphilus]|uniref:Uncharacterized protein n=1 Tax=Alkalibacillus haloalkaliphilus TaxID=94136 RepID=A0A511W048_9BACI|nr:hypothetical protein [Alkalibacillus haloalkaliphilus]GEN44460.1 hypothetical protein AHA02nite_02360 [Alkalibacillus haloalkaliphilus]
MKKGITGLTIIAFLVITLSITLNSQEAEETATTSISQDEAYQQVNQMMIDIGKQLQNFKVFAEAGEDIVYDSSEGMTIPTTINTSEHKDVMLAYTINEMVTDIFKDHEDILEELNFSKEVHILDRNGNKID